MIHRKRKLNRLPSLTLSAILGMGILGLSASAMADTEKKVNNLARRVKKIETSIATVSKQSGPQGPAGRDADVNATAARAAALVQPSVSALDRRTSAAETLLTSVERFVVQTHDTTLPNIQNRLGDHEWRLQNDDTRIFTASTLNSVRSGHFDSISRNYFPNYELPGSVQPVCDGPNRASREMHLGVPDGTYRLTITGVVRGQAPRTEFHVQDCTNRDPETGFCRGFSAWQVCGSPCRLDQHERSAGVFVPGNFETPYLWLRTNEGGQTFNRVNTVIGLTPNAVGSQYVQSETAVVTGNTGLQFMVDCGADGRPAQIDSINYSRINIQQ